MKSYCKNLVITRELVSEAYDRWLSGEAGKKNSWRVEREYGTADNLIDEIHHEIMTRSLNVNPIKYREHVEITNGKVREIAIESVKQQVIDYVFCICITPLLDARIGYYQTASIKGKGQVWAKKHISKWACEQGYFVKTDIRKCYPSIPHDVCKRIIRKYVKSDDVIYINDFILSTYKRMGDDGRIRELNIGSRFSLDMTNLILSFAYHHIESLHKVRRGKNVPLVRHQIWFMDDCLMIGSSKHDLKLAVRSLSRYLESEFGLETKPWKICRMGKEPITMCGFTFRSGRTTVAESTFLRAKRCFSRFQRRRSVKQAKRVCSYYGWFKHSDSFAFMVKYGIWKTLAIARQVVSANDRRSLCA